jgi:tetratricopeptide (TPR) repeat protein
MEVQGEVEDVPADEALMQVRQLELKGRGELLTEAVDLAARREAGPASMEELYSMILRSTRSKVDEAENPNQIIEILSQLSVLQGAGEAKAKALTSLDDELGKKLLNAARSVESGTDRQTPAKSGHYDVFVSEPIGPNAEREILLRRSFRSVESLTPQHFNFLLRWNREGITVTWVALEEELALGLGHNGSGAMYFFEQTDGCRGLRFVVHDRLAYEGCPSRVLGDKVLEERPVLVDSFPAGDSPTYFEAISEESSQTPLDRGRQLFEQGDYGGAARAFKEAAAGVDPLAPYEETDIRYNQARCLEAQGKLREALALFESIGDVAYQDLVDEKIRELGGGIR